MKRLIQKINEAFDSEEYRLAIVGIVYASSIVLFAVIYYLSYLSSARNFVFNQDIVSSQVNRLLPPKLKQLESDRQDLGMIDDLLETLFINRPEIKLLSIAQNKTGVDCFEIKDRSRLFRLCGSSSQLGWLSPDIQPLQFRCNGCNDIKPKTVVGPRYAMPTNYIGLPALVNTWKRELSSQIAAQEKQLNLLNIYPKDTSEVWSMFDFLYFSLTVQLGGSFGDIIPNSQMIRLATSMQLIVTTYIVIALVNISRNHKP